MTLNQDVFHASPDVDHWLEDLNDEDFLNADESWLKADRHYHDMKRGCILEDKTLQTDVCIQKIDNKMISK